MNIDERLGKLVERHEALTQSVELMAAENRAIEALLRNIAGGIHDLAQIARSHEQRPSNLEGQAGPSGYGELGTSIAARFRRHAAKRVTTRAAAGTRRSRHTATKSNHPKRKEL